MKFKQTLTATAGIVCGLLCVSTRSESRSPAKDLSIRQPFEIFKPAQQEREFELHDGSESLGRASLSWSVEGIVLEVEVNDKTPATPAMQRIPIAEAFRVDSVEFWIGRRQFGVADVEGGPVVYDYVLEQAVEGANAEWQSRQGGYRLRAVLPWSAVSGPEGKAGESFQFALQINDLVNPASGSASKPAVRRFLFPVGAVWDRPSTYATVRLSDGSAISEKSAAIPEPFAALAIRDLAYRKASEALVQRKPGYEQVEITLRLCGAQGEVFREISIPTGSGTHWLEIPWDNTVRAIFTAELQMKIGDQIYGPLKEAYFNGGSRTIAETQSPRQPPADLLDFWNAKIAAMRKVAFDAEPLPFDNADKNSDVQKFRIRNHRGNPMIVYLARKKTDGTRTLPVFMSIYPPMRATMPEPSRTGFITVAVCGSLQGEAKTSPTTPNEDLWARAEDLERSYWLDVVLDGVRALDFAASLPGASGKALVSGGSRGGWYALALAAVAPERVALAEVTSPCYSDVTMNRAMGYSSAATEIYRVFLRDEMLTGGRVFQNFRYFDPLFLAGIMRTKTVISAGLRDTICSAVGMAAAAQRVPGKNGVFILDPEAGHGGSPARRPVVNALVAEMLTDLQPAAPNDSGNQRENLHSHE